MTTVKKIAALGLAVLMTASLAACSMGGDTKWAAKAGDLTVPAGVYINELITAYSDATVDLPSDVKDPLKEQVDGVTVSQKVAEEAKAVTEAADDVPVAGVAKAADEKKEA